MRRRQVTYLAPYRAYLGGGTAVEAFAFIQNQVTDGVILHIVVIFFRQELGNVVYFAKGFDIRVAHFFKFSGTLILSRSRRCNGINLVVSSCVNSFLQVL